MDFTNNSNDDTVQLNVNGCDDPHYRYKMPAIAITITNTKGGTTTVNNIVAVTEAIYRTPADIKKFYSRALGLSAQMVNGELQLPGKIEQNILQEKLLEYIKKNVLCLKCKCPETLIIKKKLKCSACGHTV